MNTTQYDRWKDFALRMARTCFTTYRRPSAQWIEQQVDAFFQRLNPLDIVCIVDWDNSSDYPEGHPYYSRKQRCLCWDCRGKGCDKHYCEEGYVYDYSRPYLVGDMVSDALYDVRGYPPRCASCSARDRWDLSHEEIKKLERRECRCDEIDFQFREQWDEQWGDPVSCCIRAGLDLASAPSAGVLGFTICDLRHMYPEGIPEWLNSGFQDGQGNAVDLNVGECEIPVWL